MHLPSAEDNYLPVVPTHQSDESKAQLFEHFFAGSQPFDLNMSYAQFSSLWSLENSNGIVGNEGDRRMKKQRIVRKIRKDAHGAQKMRIKAKLKRFNEKKKGNESSTKR